MRWDDLFADMESQLEQELDAERLGIEAEEERLRLGRLGFRDRVVAMSRDRAPLALVLADGNRLDVVVETAGKDWIAGAVVGAAMRPQVVVPLSAIAAVIPGGDQLERGLQAPVLERSASELAARLGLGFVIRDLCRRRSPLQVHTHVGVVSGTIDRVGRDHLDVAEHDTDSLRRARRVRRIRVVPFDSILSVRI